jgi:hypothetical protein
LPKDEEVSEAGCRKNKNICSSPASLQLHNIRKRQKEIASKKIKNRLSKKKSPEKKKRKEDTSTRTCEYMHTKRKKKRHEVKSKKKR